MLWIMAHQASSITHESIFQSHMNHINNEFPTYPKHERTNFPISFSLLRFRDWVRIFGNLIKDNVDKILLRTRVK